MLKLWQSVKYRAAANVPVSNVLTSNSFGMSPQQANITVPTLERERERDCVCVREIVYVCVSDEECVRVCERQRDSDSGSDRDRRSLLSGER